MNYLTMTAAAAVVVINLLEEKKKLKTEKVIKSTHPSVY